MRPAKPGKSGDTIMTKMKREPVTNERGGEGAKPVDRIAAREAVKKG